LGDGSRQRMVVDHARLEILEIEPAARVARADRLVHLLLPGAAPAAWPGQPIKLPFTISPQGGDREDSASPRARLRPRAANVARSYQRNRLECHGRDSKGG